MLNILKVDMYKMIKTTSFKVMAALTLLLTAFVSFATSFVFNQYKKMYEDLGNFQESLKNSAFIPQWGLIGIFVGILAVMFFTSEFSYGTIKNLATKGYSRISIYFSKVATLSIVILAFALVSSITSFITMKIFVGNDLPAVFTISQDFWYINLVALCQILIYMFIAFLIASIFRSLGPALAVFLVYILSKEIIISQINNLIQNVFKWNFSIRPYTIAEAFSQTGQDLRAWIILAVYAVLSLSIGALLFKKRDIN